MIEEILKDQKQIDFFPVSDPFVSIANKFNIISTFIAIYWLSNENY